MSEQPIGDYIITVRRNGTREVVYRETYRGTRQQLDRRAGDVWSYPYANEPDIYRLFVHLRGETRAIMTIG